MKPGATLSEWIAETRSVCQEALNADSLRAATRFLADQGLSPDRCIHLLRVTAQTQTPARELVAARDAALSTSGPVSKTAAFERALLLPAALRMVDRIPDLPVDDSVKKLLTKEFMLYACPPPESEERFRMTSYSFIAMSRMTFLLRYPGGALDWERSGFPRRWLTRIPSRFLLPTLRFLALDARGFKPYLVWHLAGTVQRFPFLLPREGRKAFYRMAAAARRQPDIKALMAGSWLLSKETHRISPHLAFLAEVFLESGGIYTEAGPADVNDGFLMGDETRKKLYEAGEYRPTFGIAMCTREHAMRWMQTNRSIEALLDVK